MQILLVSICLLVAGCSWKHAKDQPAIEFTRVPPADEGGPDKLDNIEGRVTGARPDQQIVLYAKSGVWWVQPLDNQPFTKIGGDLRWKSATHLGVEYAALLVDPGYQPPATIAVLPTIGGRIAAVASVSVGKPLATFSKTLKFSGYDWNVRHITSDRNGTVNRYDNANAWTDASGFLHLRIARQPDYWTCSEVSLGRSLGYGTYIFTVRDTSHLEPAAALSLLTWDDLGADQNHREMDIELSQWGDPQNKNAGYVVQPYVVPENSYRFLAPSGLLAHSLHWEVGRAHFQTVREGANSAESRIVSDKVFLSGIPTPGGETVHINFCDFGRSKVPLQKESEAVIEKFQYLP